MKPFQVIGALFIGLGLFLTACSGNTSPAQSAAFPATPIGCATQASGITGACKNDVISTPSSETAVRQQWGSSGDLTRSDAQGAVTVEVKPINLGESAETLIFDVSMNTHSVDLSMDLAKLATLETDNGKIVQATAWDGPKGGHHVQGRLIFPAIYDGKPLLEDARELTLTIKDVDAPSRIFTWELTK